MKRTIILLMAFALLTMRAEAQLPKVSKEAKSAANPGKLLSQLANAIQPSSFTGAWSGSKGGWLSKAQKVSDALSMANTISSLAGFIKPGLFKEGSSAQNIIQTAKTVKTYADAAGLLRSFEGGLKPEAFLKNWSGQRSGWLNALNLLK
ncbi:MAG TPA: hypothetical protein VFR58_09780 [Flavisolibacter sp.]|nr:hypothetical protein [Flavisolibacter sp.]